MKQLLIQIIKMTPLYHPLRNWVVNRVQEKEVLAWESAGKPSPPPHVIMQRTLQSYAEKFDLKILVETGTYYGDMVEAMKPNFDHIYSIELSEELYDKARDRFKDDEHIRLVHGDSEVELGRIVNEICQPALFWLDGHYSAGETAKGTKDTPILGELECLLNCSEKNHVIIIDDARFFGTDPEYPTMEELKWHILALNPDINILVENDSIRLTPKTKSRPLNCSS